MFASESHIIILATFAVMNSTNVICLLLLESLLKILLLHLDSVLQVEVDPSHLEGF